MPEHPYGWLSLAPPVVAVVLAIATRRVLVSLLAGLAIGALVLSHGNPAVALVDLLETQLWTTLTDPGKLRVFAFTLLLGATIGVIYVSGGMRGMVDVVTPWARTRRSGQFATWVLGLLVFFDDYANSLLLGSTLRPTCDRLRISREKLAFLVDSTAAPVAGLALVSTWIAVEIDYVGEGLSNLDATLAVGLNPFELFVACIPYRFYVIQMLLFVPLVALARRDFGPMLRAERRAVAGEAHAAAGTLADDPYDDGEQVATSHWSNAVVPLGVTLAVVMWLIYATGAANVAASEPDLVGFERFRRTIGAAESSLALYYGALAGLVLAAALARWRVGIAGARVVGAAGRGARVVLPAIAILWLASTMSRMTSNKSVDGRPSATAYEFQEHRLYTGDFLKLQLLSASGGDPTAIARWLPTIVFLLASVVSFCTGTSYGTMGILVPMVVPLAAASIGATAPGDLAGSPVFLCALGSVLAGAVFGDHCSPISDTTILSSVASGCDHIAHVRTQLPYALVVAGVATLLGTLLIGFGVSVWLLLPVQTATLVGLLFMLGRKADGDR
jgi:Na+/H+ antiporter NhaC